MSRNDRFVRWQTTTISQFGFVSNLLLVLATGALAFALDERDERVIVGPYGPELFILSVAALLVSVVFGVACALNRLLDFRGTAKIARGHMNDEEKAAAREYVAGLGQTSWLMLYGQAGAFVAGALLLTWLSISMARLDTTSSSLS